MNTQEIAESWRRRLRDEEQEIARRAQQARAAAVAAARELKEHFEVTEVYLFGSRVHGPRHAGFDIDLAVRGLDPRAHFRALARVCEIAERSVDLVPLETCANSLRKRVLAEGVQLDVR